LQVSIERWCWPATNLAFDAGSELRAVNRPMVGLDGPAADINVLN